MTIRTSEGRWAPADFGRLPARARSHLPRAHRPPAEIGPSPRGRDGFPPGRTAPPRVRTAPSPGHDGFPPGRTHPHPIANVFTAGESRPPPGIRRFPRGVQPKPTPSSNHHLLDDRDRAASSDRHSVQIEIWHRVMARVAGCRRSPPPRCLAQPHKQTNFPAEGPDKHGSHKSYHLPVTLTLMPYHRKRADKHAICCLYVRLVEVDVGAGMPYNNRNSRCQNEIES